MPEKAEKTKKLSTEPYKGVRDFYPADMAVQNYIFDIWKKTAESFGYEEYGASVLEPADLYKAKSGEEIVNEQTYTFTDRGERQVTLRPEMTPTLARMVAAKKRELVFPLRWYSIPNLFRYEQPQRGRVREHWQLNVDVFGIESLDAEVEVIQMAYEVSKAYGMKDKDFEIRINNRKLLNYITRNVWKLDEDEAKKIAKLIDRKLKLPQEIFVEESKKILGKKVSTLELETFLESNDLIEWSSRIKLPKDLSETEEKKVGLKETQEVISKLKDLGIKNVRFDQTLMRGFDYYTGIVFEVFDLNPVNRRSVFGGGRYDDLLSLFGNDKVPAVGFGAGDVIARDIMETYGTLPKPSVPADYYICIKIEDNDSSAEKIISFAEKIAENLRAKGSRVAVDFTYKKIGDQIKSADKRGIPNVIVIGPEEVKSGKVKVKNLASGEEKDL
jgi:histidyl-tRNA synthetase